MIKNSTSIFYFKTDVVFSGRSCIGAYDDENDHLLEPHQETKQISRDSILLWAPLFDTNKDLGGLRVYKDSHKHGYFDHTLDHPLGDKGWTNQYTHVDRSISSKFEPRFKTVFFLCSKKLLTLWFLAINVGPGPIPLTRTIGAIS